MYIQPTAEKTIKVIRDPGRAQSLDTMNHLQTGGVPIHAYTVSLLTNYIKANDLDGAREELLIQMRCDPGLTAQVLKELSKIDREESIVKDPFFTVKQLSYLELERLLHAVIANRSHHKLHSASRVQLMQLKQTIVSTVTAQKIANMISKEDASFENEAFLTSFMRQYSYNLIAWNYPGIFIRALHRAKNNDQEMLEYLQGLISLNPKAISFTIAREWNLSPECRRAIVFNEQDYSDDDSYEKHRASTLVRAAEVGEKFAKSQEPNYFPNAKAAWEKQAQEIESEIGSEKFRELESSIEEDVGVQYEKLAKALGRKISTSVTQEKSNPRHPQKIINGNAFLTKCPEFVRVQFAEVYKRIDSNSISIAAIERLFGNVIPSIGFSKGCLFVLDRAQTNLIPMIQIGERNAEGYRRYDTRRSGVIPESLYCTTPVKQQDIVVDGRKITLVCGAWSLGDRDGVLYLELSDAATQDSINNSLLYFEAVKKCFIDCMGRQ